MLYNVYHEYLDGGNRHDVAVNLSVVNKMVEAYWRGSLEVKSEGRTYIVGETVFQIFEVPSDFEDDMGEIKQYFEGYLSGSSGEEVFGEKCENVTSQFLKGRERGELVDYFNIYINDGDSRLTVTAQTKVEVLRFLDDWAKGVNPIWIDSRSIKLNSPISLRIFEIKLEFLSKKRGDITAFMGAWVARVFNGKWTIDAHEYFGVNVSSDFIAQPFGSQAPPKDIVVPFDWSIIHAKIEEVAKPRFRASHFADAVEASFKEINEIVKKEYQTKTGIEEDGASLMRKALTQTKPVYTLANLETESGKNIQEGYMHIFAGAMIGIRNPKAHSNISIDAIDGWEKIVIASHLMKLLDKRIDTKT